MGLDFSYLLFFERVHMWDALQRVVKISEKHNLPTVTHFPVHDLPIPLKSVLLNQSEYQHDDPLIVMGTVLFFQEDEVILDHLE